MLIAGLDEAGRGPVLGSLVVGCVLLEENQLEALENSEIDDSKKLSPKKRDQLAEIIKNMAKVWKVLEIPPAQINALHADGMTLNQIEEMHFAKILNEITPKPDIIYLDAADVKEERFGQSIGKLLTFTPKKIISKHKGDSIFKIVGAASILAKTRRDAIIEELKQLNGDIGSGYPSDPKTRSYLDSYYQEHHSFPPFVRTWWGTAIDIVNKYTPEIPAKIEKRQKKITDFGKK
jgi:ribonuclease HII